MYPNIKFLGVTNIWEFKFLLVKNVDIVSHTFFPSWSQNVWLRNEKRFLDEILRLWSPSSINPKVRRRPLNLKFYIWVRVKFFFTYWINKHSNQKNILVAIVLYCISTVTSTCHKPSRPLVIWLCQYFNSNI